MYTFSQNFDLICLNLYLFILNFDFISLNLYLFSLNFDLIGLNRNMISPNFDLICLNLICLTATQNVRSIFLNGFKYKTDFFFPSKFLVGYLERSCRILVKISVRINGKIFATVITQLVVYQANKVNNLVELWCNGSMPDRGSGDSRFEYSKL